MVLLKSVGRELLKSKWVKGKKGDVMLVYRCIFFMFHSASCVTPYATPSSWKRILDNKGLLLNLMFLLFAKKYLTFILEADFPQCYYLDLP